MLTVCWYLTIYSVLGWGMEVIYAATQTKTWVNRGFLNGPYCPIYGFGATLMIWILSPFKNNLLIMFIISVLLLSFIELVTGYCLEKLFNEKWWDYSERKFNLFGYICLEFSLMWGVGMVLAMLFIHPLIDSMIKGYPLLFNWTVLSIVMIGVLIDLFFTIKTLVDISQWVLIYHSISTKVSKLADSIKESVLNSSERLDISWEEMDDRIDQLTSFLKNDLGKLKDLRQKMLSDQSQTFIDLQQYLVKLKSSSRLLSHRIFNAYPRLKKLMHNFELKKLENLDISKVIEKNSNKVE